MQPRTFLLAGVALLAVALPACGSTSSSSSTSTAGANAVQVKTVDPNGPEINPAGDIPDNQVYVAYQPAAGGYTVKVPEGWARTASGTTTSFTDKLNRIEMASAPATAALTAAQATKTDLPALAKSIPGLTQPKVTTVARPAGKAVLITYLAPSPADPVTGKTHTDAVERYVYFHNGKRITLTLSGPKGADNVDPWKIVTDSLRYTG